MPTIIRTKPIASAAKGPFSGFLLVNLARTNPKLPKKMMKPKEKGENPIGFSYAASYTRPRVVGAGRP